MDVTNTKNEIGKNTKNVRSRSLISMKELNKKEIKELLDLAAEIKQKPKKYKNILNGKILFMFFEKPSLRTRLSFDVAMKQLGGETIVVDSSQIPLGTKETIEDTAKVCGRYVDCIMARVYEHEKLGKLRENAGIPIINGLSNDEHPVQILADLFSIREKKGWLKGLKLCFLGDGNNNVTHSLLIGCAIMGIDISIGCPLDLSPKKDYVTYAKKITSGGSAIFVTHNPREAIKDADIVYTDSWISYHIPASEKEERLRKLMPYQVNAEIVRYAKKDFVFMNCLPAMRGYEQTAEIIDGSHSIVFDQAENRLYMQKALLVFCLAKL